MEKKEKEVNDFMQALGFPSMSDQIIEDDGSINETLVLKKVFAEIKGKYVQIGIMASEEIDLPVTTITAKAECVANIFGAYLELVDVSGDKTYLADKTVHYHPKNSDKENFVFCCAKFAENHDPKKDDLLVLSIRSILFIKMGDKKVFEYKEMDGCMDLLLNGKSIFA